MVQLPDVNQRVDHRKVALHRYRSEIRAGRSRPVLPVLGLDCKGGAAAPRSTTSHTPPGSGDGSQSPTTQMLQMVHRFAGTPTTKLVTRKKMKKEKGQTCVFKDTFGGNVAQDALTEKRRLCGSAHECSCCWKSCSKA